MLCGEGCGARCGEGCGAGAAGHDMRRGVRGVLGTEWYEERWGRRMGGVLARLGRRVGWGIS